MVKLAVDEEPVDDDCEDEDEADAADAADDEAPQLLVLVHKYGAEEVGQAITGLKSQEVDFLLGAWSMFCHKAAAATPCN
jgi:hypothetical protein